MDRWSRGSAKKLLNSFIHTLNADDVDSVLTFDALQIIVWYDDSLEAEFGGFLQTFLAARRGANLAGKADFAEDHQLARQRLVAQRGDDGQQHREVGRRLGDLDAADGIDEHVLVAADDAGMTGQYRQRWLDWRARKLQAFLGRVTQRIQQRGAKWKLFVYPITLTSTMGNNAFKLEAQTSRAERDGYVPKCYREFSLPIELYEKNGFEKRSLFLAKTLNKKVRK